MKIEMDSHRNGDGLPAVLDQAVHVLRDAPEPSDLWRRRVLGAVAATPRPGTVVPATHARWSFRPAVAVAAAIGFMIVGSVATSLVFGDRASGVSVASSVAAPPTVRFTVEAPSATTVSIVGDFNAWNPRALPMRRSVDGRTWEIEVPLEPGRYAYSFMIDGALSRDPRAPRAGDDDFGSPSSIVMVRGS